jgi:hypothetical protein
MQAGVNETGGLWNVKHPVMGRLSYELAYVVPNDSLRRVYMTDDGDNRMFSHFVATTPGDLSCGTLWGAKFTQLSALNGAMQIAGHTAVATCIRSLFPPKCDEATGSNT